MPDTHPNVSPPPLVPRFDRWLLLVLVLLLGPAFLLDELAYRLVAPIQHWAKHESAFWFLAKQPGEFWVTVFVCVLLWTLHEWRWRASVVLVMGVVIGAWVVHTNKWIAGRHRPVTGIDAFDWTPFRGGLAGYFDGGNLSFTSGHAAMAFTLAAGLCYLVPRGRWLWVGIASLTALERVVEHAHWLSDVVIGAIVGVVSWHAAHWLCLVLTKQRPLTLPLPDSACRRLSHWFGYPHL